MNARLLVLLAPALAFADPTIYGDPDNTAPPHSNAAVVDDDSGLGLAIGGGVSGFWSEALRNSTSAGGNWDARVTFGLRAPLAFELSYIGSLQQIDSLGLDDNAFLASHGAQGALRLNALSNAPASPYLFAGIAWRHYDIVNTNTNTSDLEDSDDVFEFPFGLGISTQTNGLLLDLRGEFRFVTEANLAPDLAIADDGTEVATDTAPMHRWGINLTVGVAL